MPKVEEISTTIAIISCHRYERSAVSKLFARLFYFELVKALKDVWETLRILAKILKFVGNFVVFSFLSCLFVCFFGVVRVSMSRIHASHLTYISGMIYIMTIIIIYQYIYRIFPFSRADFFKSPDELRQVIKYDSADTCKINCKRKYLCNRSQHLLGVIWRFSLLFWVQEVTVGVCFLVWNGFLTKFSLNSQNNKIQ